MITAAGIRIDDPAVMIQAGHYFCHSLSLGKTITQVTADTMSKATPEWIGHDDSARDEVEAAVTVYCPQYSGRQ